MCCPKVQTSWQVHYSATLNGPSHNLAFGAVAKWAWQSCLRFYKLTLWWSFIGMRLTTRQLTIGWLSLDCFLQAPWGGFSWCIHCNLRLRELLAAKNQLNSAKISDSWSCPGLVMIQITKRAECSRPLEVLKPPKTHRLLNWQKQEL